MLHIQHTRESSFAYWKHICNCFVIYFCLIIIAIHISIHNSAGRKHWKM